MAHCVIVTRKDQNRMADIDKPNEYEGNEVVSTVGYGSAGVGPGAVIGRYKLLRILGEGGYGIVYLAEQQRPVKRLVALKGDLKETSVLWRVGGLKCI